MYLRVWFRRSPTAAKKKVAAITPGTNKGISTVNLRMIGSRIRADAAKPADPPNTASTASHGFEYSIRSFRRNQPSDTEGTESRSDLDPATIIVLLFCLSSLFLANRC